MEKYKKKILRKFGIRKKWRVLDIGSGHNPFPLATHLADAYIKNNEQRSGNPLKRDGRPFFHCSVENMSCFKDKYFDFVYCSHVFEHIDNPSKACQELIRVGKRGYIETPSRVSEILFGDYTHRWIVENWNGILTFQKMTGQELLHPFSDMFYRLFDGDKIMEPETSLERIIWKFYQIKKANPESFYTRFLWKGDFKWQVIYSGN